MYLEYSLPKYFISSAVLLIICQSCQGKNLVEGKALGILDDDDDSDEEAQDCEYFTSCDNSLDTKVVVIIGVTIAITGLILVVCGCCIRVGAFSRCRGIKDKPNEIDSAPQYEFPHSSGNFSLMDGGNNLDLTYQPGPGSSPVTGVPSAPCVVDTTFTYSNSQSDPLHEDPPPSYYDATRWSSNVPPRTMSSIEISKQLTPDL